MGCSLKLELGRGVLCLGGRELGKAALVPGLWPADRGEGREGSRSRKRER